MTGLLCFKVTIYVKSSKREGRNEIYITRLSDKVKCQSHKIFRVSDK